jgi:hypothetical protein
MSLTNACYLDLKNSVTIGSDKQRLRTLAILAICMLWFLTDARASDDPRRKISLNSNWSYSLEQPDRDGSTGLQSPTWQTIDLPHSWNAADSRNKARPYHRGSGRYRKTLFIAPELAEKTLYLYFEGANQTSEVTVNGRPAGTGMIASPGRLPCRRLLRVSGVLSVSFARCRTGAFRVDINGLTREMSDLAPFTRREIALSVAASGGQGLTIRLVGEAGDAFVNGIVVQKTSTAVAERD